MSFCGTGQNDHDALQARNHLLPIGASINTDDKIIATKKRKLGNMILAEGSSAGVDVGVSTSDSTFLDPSKLLVARYCQTVVYEN